MYRDLIGLYWGSIGPTGSYGFSVPAACWVTIWACTRAATAKREPQAWYVRSVLGVRQVLYWSSNGRQVAKASVCPQCTVHRLGSNVSV